MTRAVYTLALAFTAALLLQGCRFDPTLPADLRIACQSAAECPTGLRCSVLLQRCVSQAATDTSAPQLSATLSASIVRPGTAVDIALKTSEPAELLSLRASPEALALPMPSRFTSVESTASAVLQVAPTAADGVVALRGTVVDAAGNENVDVDLGAIEVDGTAPQVRAVTISRTLVKPDQDVLIQLAFSEPVVAGVHITTAGGASALTTLASTETSAVYTASLRVPANAPDGLLSLTVDGVVDRAGNGLVTGQNLGTITIDGTAPVIVTQPLSSTRYSRNAGFNKVAVPVLVDDTSAAVVVCLFNDCRMSRHAETVEFAVDTSIPEGPAIISLLATDAAGNTSRQVNLTLTFDYTPPQLVPSSTSVNLAPPPGCPLSTVSALTAGSRLTLQLGLSEPVAMGTQPTVSFSGPFTGNLTLISGLNGTYFFETIVPSTSTANGALQFTLSARDDVDNQASVALPNLTALIDTVPPQMPPVSIANRVTYTRAPWGTVTGGPSFSVQAQPGSIEPGTTWRILSAANANAGELARLTAPDAGMAVVDLPVLDRAAVFISAVDSACNSTAPIDVKDVVWVVTSGGKVAGSSVPNPHGFVVARSVTSAPIDTGALAKNIALRDGQLTSVTTSPEWVQRLTLPPPRSGSTLVWDTVRRRAVLFGGFDINTNTYFNDLWEFDGAHWVNRTPSTGTLPGARAQHGLAFDSVRGRVVLFGGVNNAGALSDTWEWDGAQWFNRGGTNAPNARRYLAMAYDPVRQRTVLFGGASSNYFNDTWEWDGSRWTNRNPSNRPQPRFRHAMTFDASRNKVVLFGGGQLGAFANDLWEWDGTAWVSITPGSGTQPSGRHSPGLAFDPVRQKLVVFGGTTAAASSAETWEFGNTQWLRVATTGPAARTDTAAVFDPVRGQVVLTTGGDSSTVFNDTWVWAGSNWLNQTPPTAPLPAARAQHVTAFDASRNKTVLFGGGATSAGGAVKGDLWQFDGETWAEVMPDGGVTPSARRLHSMAFDSARNTTVIFGGFNSTQLNDLWEWNGAQFAPLTSGSTPPQARFAATLVYDAPRAKMLMYSGGYISGPQILPLNDLWEWSGTAWQSVTPSGTLPPARAWAGAVFDPGANGMLVLAGSGVNQALDDQWLYTAGGWSRITPPGNQQPTSRTEHALAYDSARQRTVLFGGTSSSNAPETWEWDRQAWEDLSTAGQRRPSGRRLHSMSYDSRRQVSVMFGGAANANNTVLDDTWEWGTAASARPGFNALVIFGSASADVTLVNQVSIQAVAGASGWVGSTATPGVTLGVWENDAFIARATSTAPATAPDTLNWSTTDSAQLARLFVRNTFELSVALTPVAPADGSPAVQPAELAIDSFEVTVRYRRP